MPCIKNGIVRASPFINSMKFYICFTEGQPKKAYKPVTCMNIHVLVKRAIIWISDKRSQQNIFLLLFMKNNILYMYECV